MSDLSSHLSLLIADLKAQEHTHTNAIKRHSELLKRASRELQEAEAAWAAVEAVRDTP